jgi:hypothetical protein
VSQVASVSTAALVDLLRSQAGVATRLMARLSGDMNRIHAFPPPAIRVGHLASAEWDKSAGGAYPQVIVYCERIRNQMTEKFRRFSGEVDLVIEVRYSRDNIEGIEPVTQMYVEAVTDVLEDCRGEWRDCVYSSGRYEVKFEPVKPGGKRYLHVARITVPVQVNLS